jgi:hypothetical protein
MLRLKEHRQTINRKHAYIADFSDLSGAEQFDIPCAGIEIVS